MASPEEEVVDTSVKLTQTISTSQLPSHPNSKRGGGGGGSWWETGADRPELVAGGAAGAGATTMLPLVLVTVLQHLLVLLCGTVVADISV